MAALADCAITAACLHNRAVDHADRGAYDQVGPDPGFGKRVEHAELMCAGPPPAAEHECRHHESRRTPTPQLNRNLPYRTYDLICNAVFKNTIKTGLIHVASVTWMAAATKARRYQFVIFLKARNSGKSP
jgi:hypothetical protein